MSPEKSSAAMSAEERERLLQERLQRVDALEKELLARERAYKTKEGAKKQILLRLAPTLWDDIAAWAAEDFRSINGQIEYLLADSVKRRKKE
ncbi:MAG: hypothetical protein RR055_06950 [Oscillospiraceae bacterium]